MDDRLDQLRSLGKEADQLRDQFVQACRDAGFRDRWDYYLRLDQGEAVSPHLNEAHDLWLAALHHFYALRDGPKGFLGGRGA